VDQDQMDRAKRRGRTLDERIASQRVDMPGGRVDAREEFASMVVFLASERASYVTGTAIQVDGGLILRRV
jgi:3-oxoacyl-[acyl-carrier protein] reductase